MFRHFKDLRVQNGRQDADNDADRVEAGRRRRRRVVEAPRLSVEGVVDGTKQGESLAVADAEKVVRVDGPRHDPGQALKVISCQRWM